MRFTVTLLLSLLCASGFAQKSVTYSTNDFSLTSSNLLGSNLLASAGIAISKGDKGRLTFSTVASATDTNLNNLTVTNATTLLGTTFLNTLWATNGVTHLSWTVHEGPLTNKSSILASNLTVSGLVTGQTWTADRVLVAGANQHARTDDSVDTNEVNRLNGVTNNIQTELDKRLPSQRYRRWAFSGPNTALNGFTGIFGEAATTSSPGGAASGVSPDASDGQLINILTAATTGSQASLAGNTLWRVGRNIHFAARVKLQETNVTIVWIAITDQAASAMNVNDPAGNYAGFRYSSTANDATWKCATKDNTTQGTTDSTIAANTTSRLFEVITDDGGNVTFKIDGAQVAQRSANLPTSGTNLRFVIAEATQENVSKNLRIGWVETSAQQ